MKKLLLSLVLVSGFTLSNANAAVGLITLNPGMAIAGAALELVGSPYAHYGHANTRITGWLMVVGGIVLLDQKTSTFSFSNISDVDAQKLGLSMNDVDSFNEELDMVNAINDTVYGELVKAETKEEGIMISKKVWTEGKSDLSEGTVRVLEAVTTAYLQGAAK